MSVAKAWTCLRSQLCNIPVKGPVLNVCGYILNCLFSLFNLRPKKIRLFLFNFTELIHCTQTVQNRGLAAVTGILHTQLTGRLDAVTSAEIQK